jgi:hypothetical protein
MRLPRALVVLVSAPTLLVACQLLVGIDDDRFTVTPSVPVSDASSEEAEAPVLESCAHLGPPPRPDGGVGGESRSFVLAVDSYVLNDSTAGFDLDDACTCDPLDRSKGPAQPTCVGPSITPSCDGDAGVDNALGRALEPLTAVVDVGASFNREVDCGRGTLLVMISNYNGEANDIDVKVSIVETLGIPDDSDGGASADAGPAGCSSDSNAAATLPPRRDGTDRWDVPPGATTPGARTEISGWVNDFHLAIDGRRSPSTVPFYLGPTLLGLNGVVVSGELVPVGPSGEALAIVDGRIQGGPATSFRLTRATMGGRAPARQVLVGAGLLPNGNTYVCKSNVFQIVKSGVCGAADTVHDTSLDLLGLPCDAISVAAKFEAIPALVGNERSRAESTPCGPDWAKQTCD